MRQRLGGIRGRFDTFLAAVVLLSAGCAEERPPGGAAPGSDLAFPMLLEAGCANELCELGTWAACEALAVVETPLDRDREVGTLARNQRFEVSGANTVVRTPGVVRVRQGTREGLRGHQQMLTPGDTLYVLDYRGEGVFGVWHEGGIFPVRAFWPWDGRDRNGAGELLQESDSELWLRVTTEDGASGWVRRDLERMLDARTLFLREPGPEPCDMPRRDLSAQRGWHPYLLIPLGTEQLDVA